MKNCTITKMKVRTICTIQISPKDLAAIVQIVVNDPKKALAAEVCGAFKGINLKKVGNCIPAADRVLRTIWDTTCQDTNTTHFIVCEVLGFDGVENYGYFSEAAGSVIMTAFCNGDRLN